MNLNKQKFFNTKLCFIVNFLLLQDRETENCNVAKWWALKIILSLQFSKFVFITKIKAIKQHLLVSVAVTNVRADVTVPLLLMFKTREIIAMINPVNDNNVMIIRTRINVTIHKRFLRFSKVVDVVSSRPSECLQW
jgi:hypothetical protein